MMIKKKNKDKYFNQKEEKKIAKIDKCQQY